MVFAIALAGLTCFSWASAPSLATELVTQQNTGRASVANVLAGQGLLQDGQPPPRVSLPYPFARENAGMRFGGAPSRATAAVAGADLELHSPGRGCRCLPARWLSGSNVYRGRFRCRHFAGSGPGSQTKRLAQARLWPACASAGGRLVAAGLEQVLQSLGHGPDLRRVRCWKKVFRRCQCARHGIPGSAQILHFRAETISVKVAATHRPVGSGRGLLPGDREVGGQELPSLPQRWMRAVPFRRHRW